MTKNQLSKKKAREIMRQMLPQQTQMAIKSRQTVKVLRNITQIRGKRDLTTIKIKI